MRPIGFSETSVRNYHYAMRIIPEERLSILLNGGSLKSRKFLFVRSHLWGIIKDVGDAVHKHFTLFITVPSCVPRIDFNHIIKGSRAQTSVMGTIQLKFTFLHKSSWFALCMLRFVFVFICLFFWDVENSNHVFSGILRGAVWLMGHRILGKYWHYFYCESEFSLLLWNLATYRTS
jgi:hypothetical protein